MNWTKLQFAELGLEGYSRPTYNKLVHSAMTRSTVVGVIHIAGQLNANMQHNRANGDTSTKIGVMTP